jgi:hypothetical protein
MGIGMLLALGIIRRRNRLHPATVRSTP